MAKGSFFLEALIFIIILLALNYLIMAAMVLVGAHLGYDTECNWIYCKMTKTGTEVNVLGENITMNSCTLNGKPIDCSEIEEYFNG